jgi:hypothetical protein
MASANWGVIFEFAKIEVQNKTDNMVKDLQRAFILKSPLFNLNIGEDYSFILLPNWQLHQLQVLVSLASL